MYIYCVICGVIAMPASAGSGPALPNEELDWYQELRALRRQGVGKAAYLSEVGYLDFESQTVIAPQDPGHSYRSSNALLQSHVPFYDHETDSWTFVLHAACWEILHERTSWGFSDTSCLATLLFNLLYCTKWDTRYRLRPGHDFGGAAKFQEPFRNFTAMYNEWHSNYAAEPSKFDSVDDVRHCVGSRTYTVEDLHTAVPSQEIYALDPFSQFPLEIVHLLLAWLPSHDLQHLRLSSRSIASRSRPELLSQGFWRSRFSLDFEMGFVRPTHIHRQEDWRALYFSVKCELQRFLPSERLRNRKRIWKIVDLNVPLFDLHLPGIQLHGIPTSWEIVTQNKDQESSPGTLKQGRIITTQLMVYDFQILHVGSREISVNCLPYPLKKQYIRAIGISTVLFNLQMFVSAIRLLTKNDISDGYASHPLGYVTSDTENLLWIRPQENFIGLELATRSNGISAMRVVSMGNYGISYSRWIGDIEDGEERLAFGKLCVENEMTAFNLVSSFDAFKMTSLAIIDSSATDCTLEGSESFTPKRLIQQPLWIPNYPQTACIVQMPEASECQTYNPILNIDFGGPSGERLSKLTRIVAHMEDETTPLVGLMFDINGEDIMYGKRGRTEVSFIIDGASGERISKVIYEQASISLGIWSLEIHTNFGRGVTFVPDELQLNRPEEVDLSDEPVPASIRKKHKITYSRRTLRPPDGQIITGFTSIPRVDNGVFQTFGLLCNYTADQPMINDQSTTPDAAISPAKLCSSVGSYLIRRHGSGCSAYTYASVEGVTRIRFSRGSVPTPWGADKRISGLWLDYFDSRSSEIVGQWISEVDSMDIKPDEQIIGVSIWISKSHSGSTDKTYVGLVVQISILTSYMQSKTVQSSQSGSVDNCIVLRFQENQFEHLASFVWAFNADYDHPHVLSSPRANSESILLWDASDYSSTLPWMVPEKVFWQEINLKGQSDQVIAIEAYRNLPYGIKYMTGLKFTYKYGATNTIGHTHEEPHSKVSFGDDERIVLLEIISGKYGILDITLRSEGLEGERSQRYQTLIGVSLDTPGALPRVQHEIDFSSHQLRTSTYDENGSEELTEPRNIPEKEMVGLWGFTMMDDILALGVIFKN